MMKALQCMQTLFDETLYDLVRDGETVGHIRYQDGVYVMELRSLMKRPSRHPSLEGAVTAAEDLYL